MNSKFFLGFFFFLSIKNWNPLYQCKCKKKKEKYFITLNFKTLTDIYLKKKKKQQQDLHYNSSVSYKIVFLGKIWILFPPF